MLHRALAVSNTQNPRYVAIMKALHRYAFTVRFDDADPAGISYFSNVFRFQHAAYEDWVVASGLDYAAWFLGARGYGVPLRSVSAEYAGPLRPGQSYQLELFLERTGRSSFTLVGHIVTSPGATPLAVIRSTHVFIDTQSGQSIEIPDFARPLLA
jgi:YbgC/YbaW family acyl-CoA thioester hydrolase